MKCPFCGTEMVKRRVDVDRTWKGRTITFHDILADVCPGCGEEAYAANDVALMDSFIEGTFHHEGYPELMNLEEVSSFLRVTPQTVYNMLRDGRLRAAKVGREWRFPRRAVLELLGPALQEPAPIEYPPAEPTAMEAMKEAPGHYRTKRKTGKAKDSDLR